jgi:hypothetical protein
VSFVIGQFVSIFADIMTLESLSKYCGVTNLPGLIHVGYIPTTWINVSAYEPLFGPQRTFPHNFPIIPGRTWLQAPLTVNSKLITKETSSSKQGPSVRVITSGILPSHSPAISAQLDMMMRQLFVLHVKDRNGYHWLIGSPDNPCRFTFAGTSGRRSPDFNNQTLTWTGEFSSMPYATLEEADFVNVVEEES